jgi:hypothetical protein
MYLAGVSVRRVEDITEALWGTRVSPSTVSDLNKKIYGTIEAWRNRPFSPRPIQHRQIPCYRPVRSLGCTPRLSWAASSRIE